MCCAGHEDGAGIDSFERYLSAKVKRTADELNVGEGVKDNSSFSSLLNWKCHLLELKLEKQNLGVDKGAGDPYVFGALDFDTPENRCHKIRNGVMELRRQT